MWRVILRHKGFTSAWYDTSHADFSLVILFLPFRSLWHHPRYSRYCFQAQLTRAHFSPNWVLCKTNSMLQICVENLPFRLTLKLWVKDYKSVTKTVLKYTKCVPPYGWDTRQANKVTYNSASLKSLWQSCEDKHCETKDFLLHIGDHSFCLAECTRDP